MKRVVENRTWKKFRPYICHIAVRISYSWFPDLTVTCSLFPGLSKIKIQDSPGFPGPLQNPVYAILCISGNLKIILPRAHYLSYVFQFLLSLLVAWLQSQYIFIVSLSFFHPSKLKACRSSSQISLSVWSIQGQGLATVCFSSPVSVNKL